MPDAASLPEPELSHYCSHVRLIQISTVTDRNETNKVQLQEPFLSFYSSHILAMAYDE